MMTSSRPTSLLALLALLSLLLLDLVSLRASSTALPPTSAPGASAVLGQFGDGPDVVTLLADTHANLLALAPERIGRYDEKGSLAELRKSVESGTMKVFHMTKYSATPTPKTEDGPSANDETPGCTLFVATFEPTDFQPPNALATWKDTIAKAIESTVRSVAALAPPASGNVPVERIYSSPSGSTVVVAVRQDAMGKDAADGQQRRALDLLVGGMPFNTHTSQVPYLPVVQDTREMTDFRAKAIAHLKAVADRNVPPQGQGQGTTPSGANLLADPTSTATGTGTATPTSTATATSTATPEPTVPPGADPVLVKAINSIDMAQLKNVAQTLSGEAPNSPLKRGRQANGPGYVESANWVKSQYEQFCDTVELQSFQQNYGPNVVCTIKGASLPDEQVVVGAHLDSRQQRLNVQEPAPGGNDDGSGSTLLLTLLRTLSSAGYRGKLKRTLKVINFGGEEEGLVGSRAYARAAKQRGDKIVYMLNADMVAYHKPGEPMQMAILTSGSTPSASAVLERVAKLYVPELTVGTTDACCSDHASFSNQGYEATMQFERSGDVADPMYHNVGDVTNREGYDWDQVRAHTKVSLATVVQVAEVVPQAEQQQPQQPQQ